MDWVIGTIGALIILMGAAIWRFKLTHLLSNVDGVRLIDKAKAARLTGLYLLILGSCFIGFGCYVGRLTKRRVVIGLACFIPVNSIAVVFYMVAQSKTVK